MMTEYEASMFQLAHVLQAAPAQAFSAYMAALNTNGAAVDSSTAASLYVASKLTLSAVSGQRQTMRWLVNWAVIGVIDGYCQHSWYMFAENSLNSLNLQLGHTPGTLRAGERE